MIVIIRRFEVVRRDIEAGYLEGELVRGNVVDVGTRIIRLVHVCLEVCRVLDLYSSVAPNIDVCWRIRDGIAHVT